MAKLHYPSGDEVLLGDRVRWGDECIGVVVVMIEAHAAIVGHSAENWAFLDEGFMLEVESVGLVHCTEPEHDGGLVLLTRMS